MDNSNKMRYCRTKKEKKTLAISEKDYENERDARAHFSFSGIGTLGRVKIRSRRDHQRFDDISLPGLAQPTTNFRHILLPLDSENTINSFIQRFIDSIRSEKSQGPSQACQGATVVGRSAPALCFKKASVFSSILL